MLEIKNIATFTDEYINMMIYYIEQNKIVLDDILEFEKMLRDCRENSEKILDYPQDFIEKIVNSYFTKDSEEILQELKKARFIKENKSVFLVVSQGHLKIEKGQEDLKKLIERLQVLIEREKQNVESLLKLSRTNIEKTTVLYDKIADGNLSDVITPKDILVLKHMFGLSNYDEEKQMNILSCIFKHNISMFMKEQEISINEKEERAINEEEVYEIPVDEAQISEVSSEEVIEEVPIPIPSKKPFYTEDEKQFLDDLHNDLVNRFTYVNRLIKTDAKKVELVDSYKESYVSLSDRKELLDAISDDYSELVIVTAIRDLLNELIVWESEYNEGVNTLDIIKEKEEILYKLRSYNRDYQILREKVLKQYIESKQHEEEKISDEKKQTEPKKLIYLTTGHKGTGNVCFESGLKEIAEENYGTLAKMLEELKDGIEYTSSEKDKPFPDIKGYRVRKEFGVRIVYRKLANNTILILYSYPKKTNHSDIMIRILKDKIKASAREINYIKETVTKCEQEASELHAINEQIHSNVIANLSEKGRNPKR